MNNINGKLILTAKQRNGEQKSKANSNSRERLSVSQISGPLGSEISAFEND